jgi:hypothetical protein
MQTNTQFEKLLDGLKESKAAADLRFHTRRKTMTMMVWEDAGPRSDGYFWADIDHKYEAQATWATPEGPGRYRIWRRTALNCFDVVRLKPTARTAAKGFGARADQPLKFSGRALASGVRSFAEAKVIAEADDAKLSRGRAALTSQPE